jgi:hypothetical protein
MSATASLPRNVLDKVAPDFHQINFDVEDYIKHELNIKLDKGMQSATAALDFTD